MLHGGLVREGLVGGGGLAAYVGENEEDEDGRKEEEASHHGEGKGEASYLVECASYHGSNDHAWKCEF